MRTGLAIAGASFGLLMIGLITHDLFRPKHGASLGMVLVQTWPLTPLLAATGLLVLAGLLVTSRLAPPCRFPATWRRVGLFTGVALLLPEGAVVVEAWAYQPVKFAYVIRRIEAAATPEAERTAFALADRWGCLWEANRLTKREWWPQPTLGLQGEWLLELEWLESRPCGGQPYRAYRIVLDEDNLDVLFQRPRKTRSTNQPVGPANGSQPIRSDTNTTPSAAGSRR